MDLMLHVTTSEATPLVVGLARACERAGIAWGCFFTNDGVRLLADPAVAAAVAAAGQAVACEHSWQHHMGAAACPVALGSQTANSAMMAEARRVVSL